MINIETVKCYCNGDYTLIENYDKAIADNTQTYVCHHKMGIRADGTTISKEELEKDGLYTGRPPEELIFLTRAEHQRLHWGGRKRPPRSKEWIDHLRTAITGRHLSEEHKRKISEVGKGKKRTQSTKNKVRARKIGFRWFNNGEVERQIHGDPPTGWRPGRI